MCAPCHASESWHPGFRIEEQFMPKNPPDYDLGRAQSFGPVLGDIVVGLGTSPVGAPLLTSATGVIALSLVYQHLYKAMPNESLLRILGLGICLVDIGYRSKYGTSVLADAARKGLSLAQSGLSFLTAPKKEQDSPISRSAILFR